MLMQRNSNIADARVVSYWNLVQSNGQMTRRKEIRTIRARKVKTEATTTAVTK